MEFEEMKKIWDQQNNEPLYAYDQQALHKRIRTKLNRTRHMANTTEIGLILICIIGTTVLLVRNFHKPLGFTHIIMLALCLIIGFILRNRIRRIRRENQFADSMLGDLDQAIAQQDYLISQSRTFLWWFIVPVAIPAILNMAATGPKPPLQWAFVLGSFVLSYFVVRSGLRRKHLPHKQSLERLRETLVAPLT